MPDMLELNVEQHRAMMLDIMDDIHAFCESNGLRYYLYYGSLLGAVRHKGFIPWDDDLDIIMPRPDYNAFLEKYKSTKYECISIQSQKDYPLEFAKVHNPDTLVVETGPEKTEWGIFVDIFPLDGIPDMESGEKLARKAAFIRRLVANQRFTRKMPFTAAQSFPKKVMIAAGRLLHPFTSLNDLLKKEDRMMARYDYTKCSYASCMADIRPAVLSKTLFEDIVILPFEDRKYSAPSGYDAILRALYGDYMTPPEKKYRVSNHGSKVFLKSSERQ